MERGFYRDIKSDFNAASDRRKLDVRVWNDSQRERMRVYKLPEGRIPQHFLRIFTVQAGKNAPGGSDSPGTGCRRPVCDLSAVIHWEVN